MTNIPLILIAKPGKSVTSTDVRDFAFRSDCTMFKIDSIKSGSITISAGNSTGSITISHDLGYVPAFLVYEDGQLFPSGINCYATSTGITIVKNLATPQGQAEIDVTDVWNTYDNTNSYLLIGKFYGSKTDGAIRCDNIPILSSESLLSARLYMCVTGKDGSGNIKWQTWGIDEDDTSDFGSGPMSRTKTDAYSSNTRSVPTNVGDHVEIDVLSQVNEIKSRAGWASGNAMGFIINENDGDADCYFAADTPDSYLRIVKNVSLTTNYKVVIFKDKISS